MIARLACQDCDREDWDSQIPSDIPSMFEGQQLPPPIIVNPTANEMRKYAKTAGWIDVVQRVGFRDGLDVDWSTHFGICPDCAGEA